MSCDSCCDSDCDVGCQQAKRADRGKPRRMGAPPSWPQGKAVTEIAEAQQEVFVVPASSHNGKREGRGNGPLRLSHRDHVVVRGWLGEWSRRQFPAKPLNLKFWNCSGSAPLSWRPTSPLNPESQNPRSPLTDLKFGKIKSQMEHDEEGTGTSSRRLPAEAPALLARMPGFSRSHIF